MATREYGPLLVARENAMYDFRGTPVTLIAGKTVARQGHPIVTGHEDLWEPLRVHYDLPKPREEADDEEDAAPASPSRATHRGARTRSV